MRLQDPEFSESLKQQSIGMDGLGDRHVVEVLRALRGKQHAARRSAVVGARLARGIARELIRLVAPADDGVLANPEGSLEVDIDARGGVRGRDDVDVVRDVEDRDSEGRKHGRVLVEPLIPLPVTVDGLVELRHVRPGRDVRRDEADEAA